MNSAGVDESRGAWLRQLREDAGLTQEDLSERSGLSARAIAAIERGHTRRPYPSSLRVLIRTLGLPETAADDLLARYRRGGDPGLALGSRQVPAIRAEPGSSGRAAAGWAWPEPVPRQLPATVAHFAGRDRELKILDELLDNADSTSTCGAVGISAIGGSAGVGKTTLALHWAHRAASRFPDGQLYVNLHGFDPSGQPVTPADALHGFLAALQVRPERIPPDPEVRAGLYRSLLADRRVLIVLDNAHDAAQVLPLLPGGSGCLVIATSRRDLAPLAATQEARLLRLDVLTGAEAGELLTARLGADRMDAEPDAAAKLIRLCGRLPIALAITAARAAASPQLPLAAFADDLADTWRRRS